MKRILIGLGLACGLFAQTEVRKAVVLPSYKDLKFPPLPQVKIPDPASFTLPNGMKIYLLEDHTLPLVRGVALIRTGNLFDPPDKRGLAEMTGSVMRSGGTRAKTGDQIDIQLEGVAASVESQIGETNGTLSFSALRENTDEVLGVFHDVMTSPEFRQEKVDLEKTQTRSAISRRNDEANSIVEREFQSIIYGRNTPYGWEIQYADVDRIQRKDLVDFYKRYYFPANVMLAVYGDFSAPEIQEKLTKVFADWTVKQAPVPAFPTVQKTAAPGVFLATKADVTQTFFAIGHLGGVLRDKDYPALEVAAQILGGGFSSRLFQRIRTKLGYAYGVSANWGANYNHPGVFEISGSTQSAHTVDTIRAAKEELDKMRTGEVSDSELKTAKDTVLNGFVFNFDRPSKTLNRILTYEYYGYPRNFIFEYQKAIAAVTRADILRVAKEYFRPQDLTIVAVGNPAEFGTALSALGSKVTDIDLTIPEAKQETPKADAASAAKGKELLARMQQAMGGADHLEAVKDLHSDSDMAVQGGPGGPGGMKAKQHISLIRPNILRQDQELPFGKISVYFDGKTGWLSSPQGTQPLPPPVVKQVESELFRQLVGLALSDRDASRTVSAVAADTLDIFDAQGNRVRLQLDAAGLPSKVSYEGEGMTGKTQIEQTYSEWKEVSGVKLPFAAVILQNGQKYADVKYTDYKINSGLKQDDLSKKP